MWHEQLGEAISFRDPLPPLGRKDTFSHLPTLHTGPSTSVVSVLLKAR